MFVVWRQRPIAGTGGGPFLTDATTPNGDRTGWKPLRCDHLGAGRVAWTPLAMQSERRGGKPRQTLLDRLPTIRSCCIADGFNRAAWWYDVEQIIDGWEQAGGEERAYLTRDRSAVVSKLREVVPPPTPAGVRRFSKYRKGREVAAKAARDAFAERIRAEAERRRSDREGDGRSAGGSSEGARHDRAAADPLGCFALLGLGPEATLDEVKRRHRELAMQHHPDRGGDAGMFHRVRQAYEDACRMVALRSSA